MKLLYPVKDVEKFITQHFGENPQIYSKYKIGGVPLKSHEGLDLRAPTGAEIVACDEGFIQEAIDQGTIGYGKYVKIIHPWGESVYAHFKEFKVKQGAQVKRGQVIGLANSTGNSTASHLHFSIRIYPYKRDDGWGGYSDPEPHLFGEDQSMPSWTTNLKPFFSENNLKDDQIEGAVRDAFGSKKILDGFTEKWIQKFNLQEGSDLSTIENEIIKLMEGEDLHQELLSSVEQVVGHYETPEALRNALRAVMVDLDELSKSRQALLNELDLLKKKKVLDRHEWYQLIWAGILSLVKWGDIKNGKS